MSRRTIKKAVIPAAGMGTRFLPATKSMPKEMLPIVDKPVLQFVVEEAVAAGLTDILIVTGRGKQAIENHFDGAPELEQFLREGGKESLAEQVRSIGSGAQIHYIRQREQLGLGDAVRVARAHVAGEPFAVLLGDTIIDPPEAGLPRLIAAYEKVGAGVVAVHRVPRDRTHLYGVVDGHGEDPGAPELLRLRRLVEKPRPADAPSELAIAGRYVFTAEIFDYIDSVDAGIGGELQLTDAMNALAAERPLYSLEWSARRYDIGNRLDYARCFIDYALRHPDTAAGVREHLAARPAER